VNRLLYLILAVVVYVALCYTPGLNYIAKPIGLLCTFLHEFGHAFCALISGGSVHLLQVNMDESGLTQTSGGSPGLITMGGYVGSAFFGNLLLRFSTDKAAAITMKVLAIIMVLASLIWFDNLFTTGLLITFSIALLLISKTKVCAFILSFLGVASMVYIVQDFNVGPSSDLQAYESEVGLFPAGVWMYIWLVIVIVITGINLLYLLKNKDNVKSY
jgi:hypothetical protein